MCCFDVREALLIHAVNKTRTHSPFPITVAPFRRESNPHSELYSYRVKQLLRGSNVEKILNGKKQTCCLILSTFLKNTLLKTITQP